MDFYDNGVFLVYILLPLGKTGSAASSTFSLPASAFWGSGANQITAIYGGDSNYQPSTSSVVSISVTQRVGDFGLAAQLSQITFAPGGSGTVGLNLTSLNSFNGVVSLSCVTSSSTISCGVSPSSPALTGTATAMLTVTSSAVAAAAVRAQAGSPIVWLGPVSGVLLACVLMVGSANRKRHRFGILASFSLLAVMCFTAGCGGGGQMVQPPPPPPVGTAYSVVVTGTANGIAHNAKITVIVR